MRPSDSLKERIPIEEATARIGVPELGHDGFMVTVAS